MINWISNRSSSYLQKKIIILKKMLSDFAKPSMWFCIEPLVPKKISFQLDLITTELENKYPNLLHRTGGSLSPNRYNQVSQRNKYKKIIKMAAEKCCLSLSLAILISTNVFLKNYNFLLPKLHFPSTQQRDQISKLQWIWEEFPIALEETFQM